VLARQLTDAELGRIIRHGVRANGTSVWAMPSASFYHLEDADLGDIIAYVRSIEPVEHYVYLSKLDLQAPR